ncbi:dynamin family protein [Treponema sp.]|uniref:dynamin family protein n=1 Tax=Treponema sp. TaxID=166 RepID=UPI003FD8319C
MTKLKVKYQPVLQEIYIECYNPVEKKWELTDYKPTSNGQIFLQDLKIDFFTNMFKKFGDKNIEIYFKGTKMDFDDFSTMVDYYNRKNENTKFSLIENFEQLPSVSKSFEDIKETSKEILDNLQEDIDCESDAKIKSQFSALRNEVEKAATSKSAPIHLCFIGAYSTGKSTLINSLIGARLLPKADEAKTAKIFKIINSEKIQITLLINGQEEIVIERNESTLNLEHIKTCSDAEFKKSINSIITEAIKNEKNSVETQIHSILDWLNEQDLITEVSVYYPLSFMGNTPCVIYDTPGTDSDDNVAHEATLKQILNRQKNSILFIVLSPTKTEGRGNKVLFDLLNKAENDEENTNGINLSMERCFYIYNMADMLDSESFKNGIAKKTLTLTQGNSQDEQEANPIEKKIIQLNNHRTYLTSATWGLAASKLGNVSEDDKEIYLFKSKKRKLYEKNLSTSELNLKRQLEYINEEKEVDEEKSLLMASGIYTLQRDIHDYTFKYSTAIYAHSFFQSIWNPIDDFKQKTENLRTNLEKNVKELTEEKTQLEDKIISDLDKVYTDFITNCQIENDNLKSTQFYDEDISSFIYSYRNSKELKGCVLGKEKKQMQWTQFISEVNTKLNTIAENLNEDLMEERRKKKLELIEKVKECFKNNGISTDKALYFIPHSSVKIECEVPKVSTFIWSWFQKEKMNDAIDKVEESALNSVCNIFESARIENFSKTISKDSLSFINEIKKNIDTEASDIKDIIENKNQKEEELRKLIPVSEKMNTYIQDLINTLWVVEEK